ncbi:MAG: hypothetical protein WDN00_05800 [Limisphaerales bacterium]
MSAFIKIAEQIGYDFKLLKEVQHINANQMERFVKKNHRHALGIEGQKNRRARPGFQAEHR